MMDTQCATSEKISTAYASVTFAAAAVRYKLCTVNSNYAAAAAFPRSHTVAVTYVRVAACRILNVWRQKTCGYRTAFEVMTHGCLRYEL